MNLPLSILGDITPEQFLSEYWQKKPLLIRRALPEIVDLFEPSDIQELALEENVTARLITQHGQHHAQWKVKNSPLTQKDFKNLPEYWTLLVQAVDHYSLELAELWKKFSFIPQWRRDDIMVSYAPKGGSVGQHFDFYDVFLVQGFGHRRWQLGQWCDESTAFIPDQPLKLLPEMHVEFDEVLAPGDLLYVPPRLSHYGVAQDDCLTFSFGFRMPNQAQLIDRVSDSFADQNWTKTPIIDVLRTQAQNIGEITQHEFNDLKQKLLKALENDSSFETAVMALVSEAKYPDHLPEPDDITLDDLFDLQEDAVLLRVEPASRLLYRRLNVDEQNNDQTQIVYEFWANGEKLVLSADSMMLFKRLADGEVLALNQIIENQQIAEDLLEAINQAILMLDHQDNDEFEEDDSYSV